MLPFPTAVSTTSPASIWIIYSTRLEVGKLPVYETSAIEKELDHCEDLDDFLQTVSPKLQTWRLQWQRKIEQILHDTGYSVKEFALLCDVSEAAVRK